MKLLRIILLPFALLYGLIVTIRNKLFDWGILYSRSYDLPVISVGNLSCGGTGKTPHVEYIIRLLQENYSVSTLSRGYGRETKGFILAENNHKSEQIGDEALQLNHKFDKIKVAVDEKRTEGIDILLNKFPDLDVIILDDAFQHRVVKPGLSILLTNFYSLYTDNYLLPTGTLREPISGAKRADIIIVTKTPKIFSPITRRRLVDEIKPRAHQKLYFSYIKYDEMIPLTKTKPITKKKKFNTILMFTGIADPYTLQFYLKNICIELVSLNFPDHHQYTIKDLSHIKKTYDNIFTKNKIIITTEKDAMRFMKSDLMDNIKDLPIFYVPIKIEFHKDKDKFNEQIIDYVEKSRRSN